MLSALYVAAVSFFGAISTAAAVHLLSRSGEHLVEPATPGFIGGIFLAGSAVVVLQWYRVGASVRRASRGRGAISRAGYFDLTFNLQVKALVILILMPLCAWLMGHVLHRN